MGMNNEQFRKMFPNLVKELETEAQKIGISSVSSHQKNGEKASSRIFAGYTPDVIDFIRRCKNKQQADEIISFLVKKGEIDSEYAMKLKQQLDEKGVRSFGPIKEVDYYLKLGGYQ
jgi:hypothetical protein